MRIALRVEYDGSDFRGWQVQEPGVRTVQGCLEQALSRVADHPVQVTCAGRTDAGVHASAQIVHFNSDAKRTVRSWVLGSNSNLPGDINVVWAHVVTDAFHARFSAQARRYRYVIINRSARSALFRRRATWYHAKLDATRMNKAAQCLRGEHDFSSFRAQACQAKSPVRTIWNLSVTRCGGWVFIDIEANAFLHHMVRNIAGVLVSIGAGEKPVSWAQDVLELRNRALGGVTAPPEGLYLMAVRYAAEFGLPSADGSLLLFV